MKKIWPDEDTSILLLKFIRIDTNVQNCLCFSVLHQCALHCKKSRLILINLSYYLIFITSTVNFYYATYILRLHFLLCRYMCVLYVIYCSLEFQFVQSALHISYLHRFLKLHLIVAFLRCTLRKNISALVIRTMGAFLENFTWGIEYKCD